MLRDKNHLNYIRLLPCCKCGKSPRSEAAHVRRGTDGGTALKPSDKYTLPLCHNCHREQHEIGEKRFYKNKGPYVIITFTEKLYKISGNVDQGYIEVNRFNRNVFCS